jgi:Protein of unknown function (DUF2961)
MEHAPAVTVLHALALVVLPCGMMPAVEPAGEPVSVASLLREASDFTRLPRHRDWSVRLDSSYDRSGGNKGQQQFLAMDGDTALLADLHGPGAVVRFWTTSVIAAGGHLSSFQSGILRIWIDDQATPVVELPCSALFKDGPSAFVPPLTMVNASASYTYLPIPFARHCRITVEKPVAEFFYQINSIRFPDATMVRPFAVPLAADDALALQAAGAVWSASVTPEQADPGRPAATPLTIAAGASAELPALSGSGTITSLMVAAPTVGDAALRRLVLRAWFDGHRVPDLEAPVADLFGNAYGHHAFSSLFLSQTASGEMTLRLPMPYASGARLAIENGNADPVALSVAIASRPGPLPPDSLRLRADFNQEITVAGRAHPWAHVVGQAGHFVGVVQAMQSARTLGFCEGDDQVRVDQERFTPSAAYPTVIGPWNGTGTEDCFNSAWYYAEGIKALPVSACLVKQGFGRIDTFRFFLNDAPVFQQSLDAQLENGGTNDGSGDYYSSVAFWYGSGERAPLMTMPPAMSLGFPAATFRGVQGVIEGESLVATAQLDGGTVRVQRMAGLQHVWSGEQQLLWSGAAHGKALTLTIEVPLPGAYQISVMMTHGPSFGTSSFAMNGMALKQDIDAYRPELENIGLIDLGRVSLPAGASRFTITQTGRNGRSTGTDFGLDLIGLRPEPK